MESYRVQQAINSSTTTAAQGKSKQQQAIINGDFFEAFLQMITQGNSSSMQGQSDILSMLGGQASDEETMNLLYPMGAVEGEDGENTSAMEMMAALLNGGTGYNMFFSDSIKTAVEALNLNGSQSSSILDQSVLNADKSLQNNANFLQELLLTQAGKGAENSLSQSNTMTQANPILQAIQNSLAKNDQTTVPTDKSLMTTAQTEEALAANLKVGSSEGKSSAETLFSGDMSFRNSVAQAQKLIKGQAKSASNDEIANDNSMQSSPSQAKLETVMQDKQLTAASKATVDIDDLSTQIKNNLSNGSVFDKKEFSVKLKPEGLGEVTIKLISDQNKMTVSIVTATTEAAKALNEQLPTLRETMRALQIEVRDVVTNQESFSDMQQSLQQQNNGSHNQFSDNRHSQNRFSSLSNDDQTELTNSAIAHDGERAYRYI